jgi:hypothetical protein
MEKDHGDIPRDRFPEFFRSRLPDAFRESVNHLPDIQIAPPSQDAEVFSIAGPTSFEYSFFLRLSSEFRFISSH